MSTRLQPKNSYAVVLLRLILMMAAYTLCRVLFFAFNRESFADLDAGQFALAMLGGLRFDLSAVCYTNFFYIHLALMPWRLRTHVAYQRALDVLFVVFNCVGLGLNVIDFVYYPFTFKRTTSEVLGEFANETHLGRLFFQFALQYWPATLCFVLFCVAVVATAVLVRLPQRRADAPLRAAIFYPGSLLALAASSVVTLVGCRGGWFVDSHRPITNNDAGAYVTQPDHVALVLNTPFSLIRTFNKAPLEERHDFHDEAALEAVYSPVHDALPQAANDVLAARRNVVIIVIESFGANAVGGINRHLDSGSYEGFTPFLDSLMDSCRTYSFAFANGFRSIEALPSVVAGIPNLNQRYVLSHYYNNQLRSLGTLLSEMGYHTAFFHGAPKGSMGFEAFMHLAGFKDFYDMSHYNNDADFDGSWGIWDEEFLQFFAHKLNSFTKPFAATVFTLSSHGPFKLPKRYEGRFKTGDSPAAPVIGYTDYALRRFFETAAQMPWYKDTLFVLTADHGAARIHPEYTTTLGRFRIPLMLCDPSNPQLRGVDESVASHVDIMPTVLRYVGYRGPFVAFGNDLLNPTSKRYFVGCPPGGPYLLGEDEWLLEHDGKKPLALYRYRQDRELRTNLLRQDPEAKVQAMDTKLRAVIQQYNNRMRENRLVFTPKALSKAR